MLDTVVPIIVHSGHSLGLRRSIGVQTVAQPVPNAPCTHCAGGFLLGALTSVLLSGPYDESPIF